MGINNPDRKLDNKSVQGLQDQRLTLEDIKKRRSLDQVDEETQPQVLLQAITLIRQELDETTELSDKEKKKFSNWLKRVETIQDPEELIRLKTDLDEIRIETRAIADNYFKKLDENAELFGKDDQRMDKRTGKALNTLELYKADFMEQDLVEKKRRLAKAEQELDTLRILRDQLINLVGDKHSAQKLHEDFGKLRRSEKEEYLKTLKRNKKQLDTLLKQRKKEGSFKENDIQRWKTRFREATLKGQERILAELEGHEFKESTELTEEYKAFSKERRKKHEREWKKASSRERQETILESMWQELKRDHLEQFLNSKYYSPKEKQNAIKSVQKRTKQTIEFNEICVKNFAQYEKTPKKYAAVYEKAPKEVQMQYDFWNMNIDEKEKIANDIKEHAKAIQEWEKKVDKAQKDQLVCQTSAESYKKRFMELPLAEKQRILRGGRSTLDDERRKITLKAFKELPRDIQKRNQEFYDLRLKDRMKLVASLHKEQREITEHREKLHTKIDGMIKKQLLADSSAKAYHDWVDKDLKTLPQLKKMADHSDLDDKRRPFVLDAFKALPKKIQNENARFYNLDLTARIALLKKLNPEGSDELDNKLQGIEHAQHAATNLIQQTQTAKLLEMATRFEGKKNTDAETEIREEILRRSPENKENAKRLRILRGEIEEIYPSAKAVIHAAKHDPELKEKLDEFEVMQFFFERVRQSEEAHRIEGFQKTQEKIHTQDGEEKAIQENFIDATGEKMALNKEGVAEEAIELNLQTLESDGGQELTRHKTWLDKNRQTYTHSNEKASFIRVRDQRGLERSGQELKNIRQQKTKIMATDIMNIVSDSTSLTGEQKKQLEEQIYQRINDEDTLRAA